MLCRAQSMVAIPVAARFSERFLIGVLHRVVFDAGGALEIAVRIDTIGIRRLTSSGWSPYFGEMGIIFHQLRRRKPSRGLG